MGVPVDIYWKPLQYHRGDSVGVFSIYQQKYVHWEHEFDSHSENAEILLPYAITAMIP